MELFKSDIDRLILAIQRLNSGKWIKDRDIAEEIYKKDCNSISSNRKTHIYLVEMLNYLEYKRKIEYSRSGRIKLKEIK